MAPDVVGNAMAFRYRFNLGAGVEKEFVVELDPETLAALPSPKKKLPGWTALTFRQCPNCPLGPEHARCPIAANLVDVIDFFRESVSYDEAHVTVETAARSYAKQTTLQDGISSIIGIYMVTSGCPVMDKLRPMARTHLPFATLEETIYRVASMYLLAQYFRWKNGREPDWRFADLIRIYAEVTEVNRHFRDRLSGAMVNDATVNALVNLNCFADFAILSLEEDHLTRLELLFQAYLR